MMFCLHDKANFILNICLTFTSSDLSGRSNKNAVHSIFKTDAINL